MAEDGRPKGQNFAAGMRDLLERYDASLKAAISRLEGTVIDCVRCGGTGEMKQADGQPVLDRNNCALACQFCGGKGKVRV